MTRCIWCIDPNSEDDSDPGTLCRAHLAEYDGVSVSELDRMESEQSAELD